MMKKRVLLFALLLISRLHAEEIYSADFSTDGIGLRHDTNQPPPENGSAVGVNWEISWTRPQTDGSENFFITDGGALISEDWGGEGVFMTSAIDVSALDVAFISASAETRGVDVFNVGSEQFQWFYALDGGVRIAGEAINTDGSLDYREMIDVSLADSLVIGFRFDINGAGDGFSVNSLRVTDDEAVIVPMIVLNEIRTDQPGVDVQEFVELYSEVPDQSLAGLTLVVLGDGASTRSGVVERAINLNEQNFQGNYFVIGSGLQEGVPDLMTSSSLENNDTLTFLLVSGFTGAVRDDLDLDDDGVLDATPWEEVVDGVAMVQSEMPDPANGIDFEYASLLGFPTVGPVLRSTGSAGETELTVPAHIFRSPDASGSWEVGVFDIDVPESNDSPGMRNEIVGSGDIVTVITSMTFDVSTGTGQFLFTGVPGASFTIQVSSDLSQNDSWAADGVVLTGEIEESPVGVFSASFSDQGALGEAKRFYRIVRE